MKSLFFGIFILIFFQQFIYASNNPDILIKATVPQKISMLTGISLFSKVYTKGSVVESNSVSFLYKDNQIDIFTSKRGYLFQIEPGLSGGKIHFGYFEDEFLSMVAGKISLMQTWNNPVGIENEQTYSGLELEGIFSSLSFNIGVYFHIAGDDDDHNIIPTLGVGFVF